MRLRAGFLIHQTSPAHCLILSPAADPAFITPATRYQGQAASPCYAPLTTRRCRDYPKAGDGELKSNQTLSARTQARSRCYRPFLNTHYKPVNTPCFRRIVDILPPRWYTIFSLNSSSSRRREGGKAACRQRKPPSSFIRCYSLRPLRILRMVLLPAA